jgi:hypothetical protein
MKTFLVIIATAVITWVALSLIQGLKTGAERLWLISAIKVPGRMALGDVQSDMKAGNYKLAKAKMDIFVETWQRFESGSDGFRGPGIGDIMVSFSKIDTNRIAN